MNPKYTPLFQPIILRSGIQLDNRVVMAPMTNFLQIQTVQFQMKK